MDPRVTFNFTPADAKSEKTESFPQLARDVVELYRDLLVHKNAKNESPQDSQKLVDQFGRFKIWTEQTGATLETTGSLQETLQNDETLHTSVAGVLHQLKSLITTALALPASSNSAGLAPADHEDAEFTSDSEFSTDSQQEEIGELPRPRRQVSRLSLVLSHIFEQIGLLYHYSAIFRRPRLNGRYLPSKAQAHAQEVPFFEHSHVQERLRTWSGKEFSDFSFDMNVLTWRLATANTRRREQLRYWKGHPLGQNVDHESDAYPVHPEASRRNQPAPSETTSRRSRPTTVNTYSSVALSAIYESKTVAGPSRTEYSASKFGDLGNSSIRVPRLPVEVNSSSIFECPYCRMMLQSEEMRVRNTWKRHVFRDLRPYVCTITQCTNPEKMYATRREWVYHEMQMHRRQWTCRICRIHHQSAEEMSLHVQACHVEIWGEQDISAVLAASEGPLDAEQMQQCPFCSDSHPVSILMDHIAGHLEQLALFVLPTDDEEQPASTDSAALSSLNSAEDDTPLTYDVRLTPYTTSTPPSGYTQPVSSPGEVEGQELEKKTFACEQCNRVFDQIHKLNHHKRYHDRPHACPHPGCTNRFGTKTHLDRHMADKHSKTRKFHCTQPECPYSKQGGKSFPRKDNWRRHMINKHRIVVQPDDEPTELIDPFLRP
ncbi:hypothetical protein QBC38DRAFT_427754 [Podospora fimiseda]|uniref:C2H2-type domain-containing protein n=1 Tax=Podospora fimiseda TaxID=252190 RepID=A0AAN7BFL4_9PEZI|nr:hypothetical protein QBC38DRAFT_427754 [Podospora fimiseda]